MSDGPDMGRETMEQELLRLEAERAMKMKELAASAEAVPPESGDSRKVLHIAVIAVLVLAIGGVVAFAFLWKPTEIDPVEFQEVPEIELPDLPLPDRPRPAVVPMEEAPTKMRPRMHHPMHERPSLMADCDPNDPLCGL